MRAIINKELLNKEISKFLKDSLIECYDKVKDNPNPNKKDIKHLGYHTIAYFQYLNFLNTNSAIRYYKKYILSDGKENKLKLGVPYYDSKEKKLKYVTIELPFYFDNILKEVSKYLLNYKQIIDDITKRSYTDHFIRTHHIYTQYFTYDSLLSIFFEVGLRGLIALKKHWTIFNKELLPLVLEKAQVVQTKN
jgi:hypothetical protein